MAFKMDSILKKEITNEELELSSLIQKDNFVGWVYSMNYDNAQIITNDLWKNSVFGIPHNCFLIATQIKLDNFSENKSYEKEVILLRVIGEDKLPHNDDNLRTRISWFMNQKNSNAEGNYNLDNITQNILQFTGLETRVLGTFYFNEENDQLYLGSDVENFYASTILSVYKPTGSALSKIVNYIDPIKKMKAIEDASKYGITNLSSIKLGTIRYTSTNRLNKNNGIGNVAFNIFPSDFLSRRTAVLGMTRTGKSNMIKHTVSSVRKTALNNKVNIGQLIYDINGEYANANNQDNGSISDVFSNDTLRYRMVKTEGFLGLLNNFYKEIGDGYRTLKELLEENRVSTASDINNFMNMSLDEPDKHTGEYKRWQVKVAAYKVLLYLAGFEAEKNEKVSFDINQSIEKQIKDLIISERLTELLEMGCKLEYPKGGFKNTTDAQNWFKDAVKNIDDDVEDLIIKNRHNLNLIYLNPKNGMQLEFAKDYFEYIRKANKNKKLLTSTGKDWVDNDLSALLNLISKKNDNDSYITGYSLLTPYTAYHSINRDKLVEQEIYEALENGKIVILDLSVGNIKLRDKISKKIAQKVFSKSMNKFINGEEPPKIVIYIEEAHNLIGKGMDLTETWPRIAKEGAKYNISLVYATQEVSSIHPNILANTENWIITHLNNKKEINELTKFYDFSDFEKSLLTAQDVGFARVKTLSSPYVIPVQIDKFDPEKLEGEVNAL